MSGRLATRPVGDAGRLVTTYQPTAPSTAVVVVVDGGWHVERLAAAMEQAGTHAATTMLVGVHGPDDDEDRLREYVPGIDPSRFERSEAFVVHEVRPWLADEYHLSLPAERTAVWGASLGAEFALALGVRHLDVFGQVFACSPGAGFRPPPDLTPPLPSVHLVAGRQEPFFLANATRWHEALLDVGARSVLDECEGEHGGAFWFDSLPAILDRAVGTAP